MPLNTQIIRKGKSLKVSWDYHTLSAMYTAAIKEGAPDYPGLIASDAEKTFGDLDEGEYIWFGDCYIYGLEIPGCDLTEKGEQTLTESHTFKFPEGASLTLLPGDILSAYRSHK